MREQVAEMRTLLHGLVDLIGAGNWPPRAGGKDQVPASVIEADLRLAVAREDRAELREPQPDRWLTAFNKTGVQMFDGSREQNLEQWLAKIDSAFESIQAPEGRKLSLLQSKL